LRNSSSRVKINSENSSTQILRSIIKDGISQYPLAEPESLSQCRNNIHKTSIQQRKDLLVRSWVRNT
jgi:hypothetical protein